MKQKEIIIKYLRELSDWQFEYKIRALQTQFGWIGARGGGLCGSGTPMVV